MATPMSQDAKFEAMKAAQAVKGRSLWQDARRRQSAMASSKASTAPAASLAAMRRRAGLETLRLARSAGCDRNLARGRTC